MTGRFRSWAVPVALVLACWTVAGGPPAGVVVERVAAGTAAARAGLEPGDVLLGWRQGDAGGDLRSPCDLDQVAVEHAPRGEVLLDGERGGVPRVFVLAPGKWGLAARPRLDGTADLELSAALGQGGGGEAEALAGLARAAAQRAVRAWLLVRAAEAAGPEAGAGLWAEAAVSADQGALPWVHERHGQGRDRARRLRSRERLLPGQDPGRNPGLDLRRQRDRDRRLSGRSRAAPAGSPGKVRSSRKASATRRGRRPATRCRK